MYIHIKKQARLHRREEGAARDRGGGRGLRRAVRRIPYCGRRTLTVGGNPLLQEETPYCRGKSLPMGGSPLLCEEIPYNRETCGCGGCWLTPRRLEESGIRR